MRFRVCSLTVLACLFSTPPLDAEPIPMERCPSVQVAPPQTTPLPDHPHPLADLHRFATGKGIRVAVIDTGVSNHPRLGGVEPLADLVDAEAGKEGAFFDCDGHGTIVAGIIAARPGNDYVLGIAPDAQILAVRQTSTLQRNDKDDGPSGTLATVATAIERALDAGAQVINISVVSCLPESLKDRVDTSQLDRALNRAEESGAIIVAAAGNVSQQCGKNSVVYPAHSATVLAVSATHSSHQLADYSVSVPHSPLSAPGTVEIALSPRDDKLVTAMRSSSGNATFTGTSFAAPQVSGMVALLKERYPHESPEMIRARVRGAAVPGTGHIDAGYALTQLAPAAAPVRVVAVEAQESQPRLSERRAHVILAALVMVLAATTVAFSAWCSVHRR